MTQEEKFKEAKKLYQTANADQRYVLESLFPELKESEDERIRQLLIGFVKYDMSDNYSDDFSKEDCIAWLEKQGKNNMGISEVTKQKLEDNLNEALEKETPESWNEFLEKQGEQKPYGKRQECVDCQFNYAGECKGSCTMKRGEQKPWSEEDEKILSDIIKDIVHPWNEYIPDRIEEEIKWLKNKLKSLRPQNTWKPSDEQMEALLYEVNAWDEDSVNGQNLKSLYQDLKKLKG